MELFSSPFDEEAQRLPLSSPTSYHVVAMPYPGRGHINALMDFCKILVSSRNSSSDSDILVTFVVTEEWEALLSSDSSERHHLQYETQSIRFRTIPNVVPSEHVRGADLEAFVDAVSNNMEAPFEQLLDRLQTPPSLIISDTFLFWAVRVGNRRGIPVASFWPMSASMFSVCHHFHLFESHGHFPVNMEEKGNERVDYIPGISSTRLMDFSFNLDGSNQRMRKSLLRDFEWLPKAQYLLLSTIYELEPNPISVLKSDLSLPIFSIGLMTPHFGRSSTSPSPPYIEWLDTQPADSVLYVSQGSFLSVSSSQIDEIAKGLCKSGVKFLWVGRGESSRLKEICGNSGLVLAWCDQLRVLSHPSVGGFWSHCGWNSTKEGVFAGLPFLTFPIGADQLLNSKIIVEDWKIGRRVRKEAAARGDVLVTSDEIAGLVKNFIDSESEAVKDIRRRARELQKICQLAVEDNGSSKANMNAFVKNITRLCN